jgi:hypothetical protein
MLISRISRRISNGTAGRPQRCLDFQRQYDLKPARCQRITVSGRTIASASYILGNTRQVWKNAWSIAIPKISLHQSNIEQQPCPILDQPPAGWRLRQGQEHASARFAA